MRVLGIDPGTRHCGYGVIDIVHGQLTYVECGVIEPAGGAPLAEKLAELSVTMREIIQEFSPAVVAVEDVFHGINARAALVLGHARGIVLAAAGEVKAPVFSYLPAVVKKSVTGHGAATKTQVNYMVRALLGLRQTPLADAADALAVAICHAQHAARHQPATKAPPKRGKQ